jgi:glycogen debranching enzyme
MVEIGIQIKQVLTVFGVWACVLSLSSCRGEKRGPLFEMPAGSELTEAMKISVAPGCNREFSYTNKQSAFYYGSTNGYNDRYFQGLTAYRQKLLDEYVLSADGQSLPRKEAQTAVYFHQLVRDYGPVVERLTLVDDLIALVVEVRGGQELELTPLFPDGEVRYTKEWDEEQAILFVTRSEWLTLPPEPGMPRWLGISLGRSGIFRPDVPDGIPAGKSAVGSLTAASEEEMVVVFAADYDQETVTRLIREIRQSRDEYIEQKKERLEKLLLRSYVRSGDEALNKALSWAKVSMDALVMNQDKRGIFAGLPWFNDYWGRDTFISLPGALLVTGQFEGARDILRDFGTDQLTDESNPLFGRIPNRIRPDEVIYNTADGTPWFVREAYEYILYSGDTTFAEEIYPVVVRSIEGTIRYRMDEHGFLKHDDADTWMDAKIEGTIPWSPRGDRACDIQALWYTQLIAGAKLAEMVEDDSEQVERWLSLAGDIRRHFHSYFENRSEPGIYDHLNSDDRPDHNYRPNQVFCLTVPFSQPFRDTSASVGLNGELGYVDLNQFAERLVYPHGVGSLWKRNYYFHPYHHHPNYHYDASYHNGILWTWNSGPVVTAFCREGRTYVPHVLFDSLTDQILNTGAVGTIAELIDVAPKPGHWEPELSGTFTQAWSLAEYVRNFYQDFLGVYPLFETYGFRFNPSGVLQHFGTIRFILVTGNGPVHCVYDLDTKKMLFSGVEMTGELPIVVGDREYVLSSVRGLTIPLPELRLEPQTAGVLAEPDVPATLQSLMVKDFLEKNRRAAWNDK